jgi:hypothetical protein
MCQSHPAHQRRPSVQRWNTPGGELLLSSVMDHLRQLLVVRYCIRSSKRFMHEKTINLIQIDLDTLIPAPCL